GGGSMSLMLYAIAVADAARVDGAGIDGRPLHGISDGELVAVVSEVEQAPDRRDPRRLWEYERVVELLMGERPLLPARFGSVFADAVALRQSIRERRAELTDALRQLDGAIELAVRADAAAREHRERDD